MSNVSRRQLFGTVIVDGNIELDYLNTSLAEMELRTVQTVTVNSVFENRPDLLAFQSLGSYHLGWLIAWHNDLKDPVGELVIGKKIKIPSIDDYYRFVSRNKKTR